MLDAALTQPETAHSRQWPAVDAGQLAQEVARVLRETGLAASPPPLAWISLEEAARMFGYSVSRFYHVYSVLGLVPSRASQRKLRFNRLEVERALRERQRPRRGRSRREVQRRKSMELK